MKILVTGATGFIGRHFLPMLVKEYPSCEILTINRDVEKARNLYSFQNCQHISTQDLCKLCDFKPEIVFHLASFITSRNDDEAISQILQANIVFGVELLKELGRCSSVKLFVNLGTFAEYRMGASEINNAYLYSASKTAFKQFTDYYSNLCNYKYVHIVPYTVYGGSDSQKKIIDYIYDSFSAPTPIKMTAGEQILDFIHVFDVSSFLCFLALNLEKILRLPNGEVLHLGTGIGTQIKELAVIMENTYKQKCNIEWGALPYRDMDVMHAIAPIAKLIELGWRTKHKIEEIVL